MRCSDDTDLTFLHTCTRGVFPTSHHIQAVSALRHISHSDLGAGLAVHGLRVVFGNFAENRFRSPRSQVDELQDLHVMRHVRVFLGVPLPIRTSSIYWVSSRSTMWWWKGLMGHNDHRLIKEGQPILDVFPPLQSHHVVAAGLKAT